MCIHARILILVQNWPLWQRDFIIFILSFVSVIATTLSPLLAADTVTLAAYFTRTFTDMALLTGYHLLGVGFAGFLFVPSARIWGKRHCYLLGTIVVIFSAAWGGANGGNYTSLLWARIFQGVGLAPFEALVNASVGDLYHVHERGIRMAVSNLSLFGGAFLTPVIVGVIADEMNYTWTFYFVAIFTAASLPLIIFFCPETAYKRDSKFDIDTMGNLISQPQERELKSAHSPNNSGEVERDGNASVHGKDHSNNDDAQTLTNSGATHPPPKATWAQSLMPFNGRKTDERYLNLLLRPFPLFLHPGMFWVCTIG